MQITILSRSHNLRTPNSFHRKIIGVARDQKIGLGHEGELKKAIVVLISNRVHANTGREFGRNLVKAAEQYFGAGFEIGEPGKLFTPQHLNVLCRGLVRNKQWTIRFDTNSSMIWEGGLFLEMSAETTTFVSRMMLCIAATYGFYFGIDFF